MLKPTLTGMIIRFSVLLSVTFAIFFQSSAQKKATNASIASNEVFSKKLFSGLKWRCIGPFRSGRSIAVIGVVGEPMVYYAGQTGGGVWKTTDGGLTWLSVSDSNFTSS